MIEFLIALSFLKKWDGAQTYLNIIPAFLGLFFLFKFKKINKDVIPLILMIAINLLYSIFNFTNLESILRLGQFSLLLLFADGYSNRLKEYPRSLDHTLKYFLVLTIFYLLLEIFIFKNNLQGHRLFDTLPRYHAITGDPNFSCFALAFASMFWFLRKSYLLSSISLFLVLFISSKAAFLSLTIFVILNLLRRAPFIFNKVTKAIFYLVPLYPAFIFIMTLLDPNNPLNKKLVNFPRYPIHITYMKMGLENPFGVGYFNGKEINPKFSVQFNDFIQTFSLGRAYEFKSEQHSLYMQIFSEFGPITYPLFLYFLFLLFNKSYWSVNKRILFISILIYCLTLNSTHELALLLTFSVLLSKSFKIEQYSNTSKESG